MKKEMLIGLAGIGVLLGFSSCASGLFPDKEEKVSPQPAEETVTASHTVPVPSRLVRQLDIPLVRMDAMSVYRGMINYITPDDELAPSVTNEQLTAYIDYPAGSVNVNAKYGNNRAELQKLKERLRSLLNNPDNNLKSIRLTGFASPDGDTKENERLAGNRAIQFKNYLIKELGLKNSELIVIDWSGEDWSGLRRIVAGSGKPYASNVVAIIDSSKDPDKRRSLIKALNKGETYKDIEKNYFSRLRRMQLTVESESRSVTNDNNLVEQAYSNPDKLKMQDFFRVASLYRPGTEQYREVYEIAAYTYPSCAVAQLNAAAAALALGDKEEARYFLQQANGDRRAYNNLGVLYLMDGDKETAKSYFRKFAPQNPRLSRENMRIADTF